MAPPRLELFKFEYESFCTHTADPEIEGNTSDDEGTAVRGIGSEEFNIELAEVVDDAFTGVSDTDARSVCARGCTSSAMRRLTKTKQVTNKRRVKMTSATTASASFIFLKFEMRHIEVHQNLLL